MPDKFANPVDITLLVCTYNRSGDLCEMLETALSQETKGEFTYDVLIVDNNSSDDTDAVVENFVAAGHKNLRYIFELKQGKGFALNAGLKNVCASIYAIADDDLILPRNYLHTVFTAFTQHPDISFVGGKVLPLWKDEVPSWLNEQHWSAIAMSDYGDAEISSSSENPITLLAGAFRVSDVKAVGGYQDQLGVSKNNIGGTEDVDLYTKLWQSGRKGLYIPKLYLHHKVEPHRLTKSYHRKWHTGHGAFYAAMRDKDFEISSARLFDVPAHMFRQAAANITNWTKHTLLGKADQSFIYETELRFFAGFFRKRVSDFRASGSYSMSREIITFLRSLLTRPRT